MTFPDKSDETISILHFFEDKRKVIYGNTGTTYGIRYTQPLYL